MFKIIAALAFLDRHVRALANLLADVRERILGAAITATSEHILNNIDALGNLSESHQKDVDTAGETLRHNIKLAYEEHTASLQLVGQRTEAVKTAIYAKQRVLRDKRAKLRGLLTDGE